MHERRLIHARHSLEDLGTLWGFILHLPPASLLRGGPTMMDDHLTLAEARAVYLAERGLGDGGYDDPSVRVRFGPLVVDMPNTRARRRAVPLHDLHHALTGYDTDWRGECAISGWETAAGCGRFAAAWALVLASFGLGALAYPLSTYRAFARGRGGSNLFREYPRGETPELLGATLGEVRARLGLDRPPRASTLLTPIAFAAWACVALTVTGALGSALLVLGLLQSIVRPFRRRQAA
jgi:hypothetical protein